MEANQALQQVIVAPSLSKATQATIAGELVARVKSGEVDPMQAFIQVKALAEVCEQFLKNEEIVEMTTDAIERCEDKLPVFNGAKVSITNTTRYDYESSNDPEYKSLLERKDNISSKLKARETFLKSLSDEMKVVDNTTGEVIILTPPMKKQSQSLRVTFAKQ